MISRESAAVFAKSRADRAPLRMPETGANERPSGEPKMAGGTDSDGGRRRREHGAIKSVVILVVIFGLWESVTRLAHVNPLLFPPASQVFMTLLRDLGLGGSGASSGQLWSYTWSTLSVLLESFAITIVIAVLLTTFAVSSEWGRSFLRTVSAIFQPLPSIALLPVAILWFGLNLRSVMFVVIMAMLWPLSGALSVGFATAPETLVRVGRNYGLRSWRLATGIYLPAALPNALSGLDLAWGYGWRAVIGAELVFGVSGGTAGLGYFINNARIFAATDEALAAIVMVIILGFVTELLFRAAQARTTKRWGMQR